MATIPPSNVLRHTPTVTRANNNQPSSAPNEAATSDSFQRIATEPREVQIAHHGQELIEAVNENDLEKVQALLATIPKDQLNAVVAQPHRFTNHTLLRELGSLDDLHNPETQGRLVDASIRIMPPEVRRQMGGNMDQFRAVMLQGYAHMNDAQLAEVVKELTTPRKQTPLIVAASKNNLEMIKALLATAKDDTQRADMVAQENEMGATPLETATVLSTLESMQTLLAAVPQKSQRAKLCTARVLTAGLMSNPAELALILKTMPKDQCATVINQPVKSNRTGRQALPIQVLQGLLQMYQHQVNHGNAEDAEGIANVLTNAGMLMAHGANPPAQATPAALAAFDAFKQQIEAHSLEHIEEYSKQLTDPNARPEDVHFATRMLHWTLDNVNKLPEAEHEQHYKLVREQFNQFLQGQVGKLEKEKWNVQPSQRQPTIALLERTRPLLSFQKQGIQCDSEKLDALGAAAVRANYLEFVPKLIGAGATWQETGPEIVKRGKPAQTLSKTETPTEAK